MKLILAVDDYYGYPGYKEIYINPNQIIEMEKQEEINENNKIIKEHYIIKVNFVNEIKQYHITIEQGKKLI